MVLRSFFFRSPRFSTRGNSLFIFRFINAYHRRAKRIKLGIRPRHRRVIRPETWSSVGRFGRYMYMVRNTETSRLKA